MKVGINGIFWGQERTGSGQYTRYLWEALHQVATSGNDHFQLLGYASPALTFDKVPSPNLTLANLPSGLERLGDNSQKLWWEQQGLPQLAKAVNFDVVHYPYFAAPLRPISNTTKLMVTVHDLIPLALPEYATNFQLRLYFRLNKAAVQRADLIVADSEFSRRDILRLLKVPPARVQVVYLGIDQTQYLPRELSQESRAELLRRVGLDGNENLIFYIGGFDIRKNIPLLLRAFEQALPRLRELEQIAGDGRRWTLALAGKPHTANSQMYPDLTANTATINTSDPQRVRFLGPVSEEDKVQLYQTAQLFVFPSRYEGFGLDPLEALACATPTICSDASSLPEVVGDAARLVAPDDVAGWRDAIIEMAGRPNLRHELAQRGPLQAARFSWQTTATRTLELYNMLECLTSRSAR